LRSTLPRTLFRDLLLTLAGVAAAAFAIACAFFLSSDIRKDLDDIQEEARTARVRAVLSALDQELQHLTDYTRGYAMWDDTYSYVQAPSEDYIESNYTPAVLFTTPVRLVAVYDLRGRLLFSRAIDEAGRAIAPPARLADLAFTRPFASLRDSQDSQGDILWLDGRGHLLTVCPVTDSSGTAPIKGYLLFGSIIGKTMLDRIEALTSVRVRCEAGSAAPQPAVLMRTPTLGEVGVRLPESQDGPSAATAVLPAAPGLGEPLLLRMDVPSKLSEPALRLSERVRTFLLIIAGAFALFTALVAIEAVRRRRELRARVLEGERLRESRDEAERLRLAAESADRAKSAFLAMMSHEIRTPLNAIVGYAELLRNAPLEAEAAQGLQSIRESADVLLRVLDDVLDFSKIEAGKLEISPEPVDLRALVGETCILFGAAAEARQNRLSCHVEPSVPQHLMLDGARVRQLLSNLLSNAVKFTESGAIRVEATWNDAALEIRVEDEGIGITDEAEKELFKPFTQAESTISRRYGGSGLGLAICRRLCELMGGGISYQARAGKGSVFAFHLPAPRAAAHCRISVSAPAPEPLEAPPSVLVVDDNLTNARLMASILQRLGVVPQIAHSGSEAIEAYTNAPADLVLMDIQMPGMDGLEATREIRRVEAENSLPRAVIVAVTADTLEHHRLAALDAGMDDYLTKPIKIAAIQRLVRDCSQPAHSPVET
jgi:signal transduction histidine kinase/ActR/RegA family two-component response regulator